MTSLLTPTLVLESTAPIVPTKRSLARFDGPAAVGIDAQFPVSPVTPDFNPNAKRPKVSLSTGGQDGFIPGGEIFAPNISDALRGSNEETLGISKGSESIGVGTFTGPRGGNLSVVALFGALILAVVLVRRTLP